jgi:5-oxoprolinase (ATP-hydrolysing)
VELFAHRFTHLALEMGEQLRRTAISTNIKERLDFSCALLDSHGRLVVNAPHIPVHLGSLGLCVRSLRDAVSMNSGDVVVTNHPAFGGSHLPDITVVTPVFSEGTLLGYVASRAHHAELGGLAPGSMPPAAKVLAEEGVVIPPTYLVRGGTSHWDEMRDLLTKGPHPTRALDDNLADLRAAVAANQLGAESLRNLARTHGTASIVHYMEALERHAEDRIRAALSGLEDGDYSATERLDDGSKIAAVVSIKGDTTVIDFRGSADVHPGNLNATDAVVRAAVMYVLRLLVNEPLPLNEGLMRTVTLKVPEGMLNPSFDGPPETSPAIVGGNVETSQRIVDTLLKALGLAACSQGTMNNLSFGDDSFGYYETVCGGSGAGPGFHGASAVHTHMTNTRITDPEIIEHRYPVRVERFAIRHGSGGSGHWRGGSGAVREIVFLKPMTLSLLSQHRREGPYGLSGGGAGLPGRQVLIRAGGEIEDLQGIDGVEVSAGDRLVLETPGGGGYGS